MGFCLNGLEGRYFQIAGRGKVVDFAAGADTPARAEIEGSLERGKLELFCAVACKSHQGVIRNGAVEAGTCVSSDREAPTGVAVPSLRDAAAAAEPLPDALP